MYPKEYIQYLVHFHGDRDYFECHEILEEYWKKQDSSNKQSVWVGFIQLAVSCYHHRRENYTGAKRTLEMAMKIFTEKEKSIRNLGLNEISLFAIVEDCYVKLGQKHPYKSFNLPIYDPLLLQQCQSLCSELGFTWCIDSDLNNHFLVHRHKLRDRTNVIQAREKAMKARKGSE